MNRYVCIHGHFYQPPRENAWLESIEAQDSADPYHDWNERIAAECFGPNARCRILDECDRILRVVNNYSRISFNFGPTLLSWMEEQAPDIYQSILEADRESARLFSGHGSALAQAYNHTILPLATRRQKEIQVKWGRKDFEHRFGRAPEGMWLPETAVDVETLEVLAANDIKFTILAPHQAESVRQTGSESWIDVGASSIDTTRPYRVALPSGAKLDVFFYDGPTSRAVAFEGLLKNGENFAKRLLGSSSEGAARPVLIHIATDGETYGHHHRFGEMALAYALRYLEENDLAKLTNYGEFLENNPSEWEVRIRERTSWSCAHGIGRWSEDCGCQTGAHPTWHQAWRAPLREALDWLAATIEPIVKRHGSTLFKDPERAFEKYVQVILDRSRENVDAFLKRHCVPRMHGKDRVAALKLLETRRYATLMYTSCGWFFDEVSGLETTQIIQYAGRVVQLVEELSGESLEAGFLERLAQAPSNIPEHRNARVVYEKWVKPAVINLPKVGAHYALSSLFEEYGDITEISRYTIESKSVHRLKAVRGSVAAGKIRVTSSITWESSDLTYAVFHLGDHILNGGVRAFRSEEEFERLLRELERIVERADFAGLVRLLDRHFEGGTYSLDSLFRDEQRKILRIILDSSVADIETTLQTLYQKNLPLMRYLESLGVELPPSFEMTAHFVLNTYLRRALRKETFDAEEAQRLLRGAEKRRVQLDDAIAYEMQKTLAGLAKENLSEEADPSGLSKLEAAVSLAKSLPFEVNLWEVQHRYYQRVLAMAAEASQKGPQGTPNSTLARLTALGEALNVQVDVTGAS